MFRFFGLVTGVGEHTGVVDLSAARVHSLEKLIDLLIAHLLSQVGQNVAQLSNADKSRHVLIEDLEAAAVLLWLARVAESAGAVEDLGEGLEIDYMVVPR